MLAVSSTLAEVYFIILRLLQTDPDFRGSCQNPMAAKNRGPPSKQTMLQEEVKVHLSQTNLNILSAINKCSYLLQKKLTFKAWSLAAVYGAVITWT